MTVVALLDRTPIRAPEQWGRAPDDRTEMPQVGSRIGALQLDRLLRRGRVSLTFRAKHLKFGIPVAVKFVPVEEVPEADRLRAMLQTEAVALARLNHPNLVRLWDLETEGPFPYLVTEFVEGYTLAELIEQVGSLHPLLAVGLTRQAVEGLAHAREHEVIHRDVKPANMILAWDGVLKLLDFGLALVEDASEFALPDDPDSPSPVTGTAAYMAPEQALDPRSVDHRADIYSLGATLYHALTGHLPFDAGSVMQMITKHLREEPVPPHEVNPQVPRKVSALVMRMLAKPPKDRFSGYDELRVALARAVGDQRTPRSQAESIMGFRPNGG